MGYFLIVQDETDQVVSCVMGGDDATCGTGFYALEVIRDVHESFLQMNYRTHRMFWRSGPVVEAVPETTATIDKTSILANGIDLATILGVVPGSLVEIEGIGTHTVDDGSFSFTADAPGDYVVTLISKGYLAKEFVVNAS